MRAQGPLGKKLKLMHVNVIGKICFIIILMDYNVIILTDALMFQ